MPRCQSSPETPPGVGQGRHEEERYFLDTLQAMEYWEEFFNLVDQQGSPDQSFFVAAAALNSMAHGVPPDPSGRAYIAYPTDHPARLHTVVRIQDRLVYWMMHERGQ